MVKKIQALARGFIARRLVSEWFVERRRLVIQWQARIRKFIDLRRFVRKLELEHGAALSLQNVIRGFLGRRRYWFLRQTLASVRIQALWRGCRARVVSDRRWLSIRATIIQVFINFNDCFRKIFLY